MLDLMAGQLITQDETGVLLVDLLDMVVQPLRKTKHPTGAGYTPSSGEFEYTDVARHLLLVMVLMLPPLLH